MKKKINTKISITVPDKSQCKTEYTSSKPGSWGETYHVITGVHRSGPISIRIFRNEELHVKILITENGAINFMSSPANQKLIKEN
jgi:hypothetical protein